MPCRILVAGGDGTIGWILNEIARKNIKPIPEVCILPVGTGNDLSRVMGWGAVPPPLLNPSELCDKVWRSEGEYARYVKIIIRIFVDRSAVPSQSNWIVGWSIFRAIQLDDCIWTGCRIVSFTCTTTLASASTLRSHSTSIRRVRAHCIWSVAVSSIRYTFNCDVNNVAHKLCDINSFIRNSRFCICVLGHIRSSCPIVLDSSKKSTFIWTMFRLSYPSYRQWFVWILIRGALASIYGVDAFSFTFDECSSLFRSINDDFMKKNSLPHIL